MKQYSKVKLRIILIFILIIITNALQNNFRIFLIRYLRNNDALGLIEPSILLVQYGILLPLLLKITKVKFNDIGVKFKNLKYGFSLSMKYFLWIIILGTAVAFIMAYPTYSSFEPRHWTILRFVDEGWSHFRSILLITALWEEVIIRGLFLSYLFRIGLDESFTVKGICINKALIITSVGFSLMHVQNFIGVNSLSDVIYMVVYLFGAVIVGYMLAIIRKKSDSLFWPIMMHALANYFEWVVTILIPILLVNKFPV